MVQPNFAGKNPEPPAPVSTVQTFPPPPNSRARSNQGWRSPVAMTRIATVVLGVIVLYMGVYSHFQSDWVKLDVIVQGGGTKKLYKYACDLIDASGTDLKCPAISMERYFVFTVAMTFILSVLWMMASVEVNLAAGRWRLADMGYHVVGSIMLLIAAIVYFVSANQIDDLQLRGKDFELKLRGGEKFVAGALAIMQSILYAVLTILIARQV